VLTPLRVVVPVASAVAMLQWAVSLGVDERCRVSRGVGSDPNVSLCDAPKWFLGFSIVLLSVLVIVLIFVSRCNSKMSSTRSIWFWLACVVLCAAVYVVPLRSMGLLF